MIILLSDFVKSGSESKSRMRECRKSGSVGRAVGTPITAAFTRHLLLIDKNRTAGNENLILFFIFGEKGKGERGGNKKVYPGFRVLLSGFQLYAAGYIPNIHSKCKSLGEACSETVNATFPVNLVNAEGADEEGRLDSGKRYLRYTSIR